ncbi:uncharacterized protein IUM83_19097 [Phytophthora cinnamomi]|uniref:uncharacterized protein n=1 Tax=Phytophthora cinnamomi TaxID=4785 RepID=UPI003559606C|nr:hypothetical protein IUM83_19097 [Phytophthora cinnamomi]
MELEELPLLRSARVVSRYCLPQGGGELPHVTRLLDAYLDTISAYWTLVTAYRRTKSLLCVRFVAARESAESQDPFYKRWLLNRAAELAARDGDLPVIQWLMESYLPVEPLDNVTTIAAANGHLEILQWLHGQHRERVCFGGLELCGALENQHEDVVGWLREHALPRAECRDEVLRSAAHAGNLDVVKCFPPVNSILHPPLELQQWLQANYSDELIGCHLAVRKLDWHWRDVPGRDERQSSEEGVEQQSSEEEDNYNFMW